MQVISFSLSPFLSLFLSLFLFLFAYSPLSLFSRFSPLSLYSTFLSFSSLLLYVIHFLPYVCLHVLGNHQPAFLAASCLMHSFLTNVVKLSSASKGEGARSSSRSSSETLSFDGGCNCNVIVIACKCNDGKRWNRDKYIILTVTHCLHNNIQ